jgi:hypothetical protein
MNLPIGRVLIQFKVKASTADERPDGGVADSLDEAKAAFRAT